MALKFLNKKGWHTGSLRNIETVWKAEQKHEAEEKKLDELRKKIKEEREAQEFRRLQQLAGLTPAQERLEFLYDSGLAVGKSSITDSFQEKPVESKKEEEQPDKATGVVPGALFSEERPYSANDTWRKLHSDPLLLIRQQEQTALARIKNNPVKMEMIKKMVHEKEEKKKEKKKHKTVKEKGSKEKKKKKRKLDSSESDDDGSRRDRNEGCSKTGVAKLSRQCEEFHPDRDFKAQRPKRNSQSPDKDMESHRRGRNSQSPNRDVKSHRSMRNSPSLDRGTESRRRRRNSQSPDRDAKSHRSMRNSQSPDRDVKSQRARINSQSPDRDPKSQRSRRNSQSPDRDAKIHRPRRNIQSPERDVKIQRPRRTSQSPDRDVKSHRSMRNSQSPDRDAKSRRPRRNSQSPDRDVKSHRSRRNSQSPDRDAKTHRPRRNSQSPDRGNRGNRHNSWSRRENDVDFRHRNDEHRNINHERGLQKAEGERRKRRDSDEDFDEKHHDARVERGLHKAEDERSRRYDIEKESRGFAKIGGGDNRLLDKPVRSDTDGCSKPHGSNRDGVYLGGPSYGVGVDQKNLPRRPPKYEAGRLTEEEKAARLREMQADAEAHEEQRWQRLNKAAKADALEAAKDALPNKGKNFLDATTRSFYGAEDRGSGTVEESVKRRAHFINRSIGDGSANTFRR